jgi:hypothetical protein
VGTSSRIARNAPATTTSWVSVAAAWSVRVMTSPRPTRQPRSATLSPRPTIAATTISTAIDRNASVEIAGSIAGTEARAGSSTRSRVYLSEACFSSGG